jgi:putative PEP-CTERM system histidine kinase
MITAKVELFLAYGAATVALGLAVFVLWRERRHFAYRAFALGMVALAVRELLGAMALEAIFESQALRWHRYRLVAEAALPGPWLWFALTFARAEPQRFLRRWRWPLAAAFLVPPSIVAFGWSSLVTRTSYPTPSWLTPVGTAGYWLHVSILLGAVAILVNLESTLRAAVGSVRWQIKFTVLGLAGLFAVSLFTGSQVVLYSAIQNQLLPFGSVAILFACAFIVFSLVWRRLGSFDVYPSEALIYNSLTLLVAGLYLLAVAGLVELIDAFAGRQQSPWVAFFVFVAVVLLAVVLLSAELRQRAKRFVSRHLKRPTHDYRSVWDEFTRRTSPLVEVAPLASAIANIAAETFGCSSATIWLVKEGERKLALAGSSALSTGQAAEMLENHGEGRPWLDVMERDVESALDLRDPKLPDAARDLVRVASACYSVALRGGEGRPFGFLTINERVTREPYSFEDFALLKTLADQAAATIRNRQLAKELQKAKEMETFQTLSTFFVHDLKNLASRLSLAMQNLPVHFDKPGFRDDLLKTMEKSVTKIDTMTGRLSSLTKGLELKRVDCDLNALVRSTLAGLNGSLRAAVAEDCREIPRIDLDPEEIQKVLLNLVLNAQEATGDEGHITVSTSRENGWVLLSVRDDGCGMSPEFVANALFKPFQTTKKNGLGIGLFQSRTIVEAHGGRIEVESDEGKGTNFKVLLPSRKSERSE